MSFTILSSRIPTAPPGCRRPAVSQYAKPYSKYTDAVKFEARLFIDGRLVASTTLDQMTSWPHIIAHSFKFPKGGDLNCLKFPAFRRELQQSFWTPADDLGRIKLVISEGFPRDSLTMPIERVKNIVAFSFQHAPLDILESSGIAWPNALMWRRAPFASSMAVPPLPSDDADPQPHSPRNRSDALADKTLGYPLPVIPGLRQKTSTGSAPRCFTQPVFNTLAQAKSGPSDEFGDASSYFEWLGGMGMGLGINDANQMDVQENPRQRKSRRTSTDISMPNYSQSGSADSLAQPADRPPLMPEVRQEDDGVSGHLRVPTNTPTTSGQIGHDHNGPFPAVSLQSSIPSDLTTSLTNSLLNQPMPLHFQQPNYQAPANEVRSRKENRRQQPAEVPSSASSPTLILGQDHHDMRRVSQQMYMPPGASVPICTVTPHDNSPKDRDSPVQSQQVLLSGMETVPGSNKSDGKDAPIGGIVAIAGTEKGMKRVRNYTPVPVRVVDSNDESRRSSPKLRLTPFTDGLATAEAT